MNRPNPVSKCGFVGGAYQEEKRRSLTLKVTLGVNLKGSIAITLYRYAIDAAKDTKNVKQGFIYMVHGSEIQTADLTASVASATTGSTRMRSFGLIAKRRTGSEQDATPLVQSLFNTILFPAVFVPIRFDIG